MQRRHGFSGIRPAHALRAGAIALGAGVIFALAMQPTHGWAEDWFDARAEAILDAYIKADCENYCLTDRGCYKRCFDVRYEEVLYEFNAASWAERDAALDNLATTFKPDLVSQRYREQQRRNKARHECAVAAHEAREARRTACYDAGWAIEDFTQRGDALSACAQAHRDSERADAERCAALQ